jgi:hypothetical protein
MYWIASIAVMQTAFYKMGWNELGQMTPGNRQAGKYKTLGFG